ncbi:hypothetical protein BASA83_011681 [Batrachochytrium salamandrivorans]|nr:hypothetical protein BASA83_011681 [Batrachochytrium salamandrivorans]
MELLEIISDRGKSFLAEGIDLFESREQDSTLSTTPYHPQTNGMVERMHAMLGHGLTTLVHGKRDRWDDTFLKFYWHFGLEHTLLLDFSLSFFCLVFILVCQLMRLHLETLWRLLTKSNGWRRTPSSLLETWRKWTSKISCQCSNKAQSEAMRKRGGFDENTPDYFFKVGDMVKMKHHERLKLD